VFLEIGIRPDLVQVRRVLIVNVNRRELFQVIPLREMIETLKILNG